MSHSDQIPAHGVNIAALTGETILRALASRDRSSPFATAAELADAAGRPRKNIHRELDQLKNARLVAGASPLSTDALKDAGRQALAALDRAAGAGGAGLMRIPVDRLLPNPLNPRRAFDPDTLESLADSFEADGDIIEPLVVSPADALGHRFIWAGHRRWRAAKLLAERACGLPVALAQGLPCVERQADPTQALFIAVVENSLREDLSPWEDAQALRALAEATLWSARELARRIGRSPNGSEAGVRDVQVKIKIAREAKPEAVADYERTRNWDRLRESVQAPQSRPALPRTDEPDLPYAPTAPVEPPRVQPAAATTQTADPDARIDLSPDERFLLIEVAHKTAHDPAVTDQGDYRFAPVGKYWLDQAAAKLQTARLILFKHAGAAGPQVSLTPAGADWLSSNGVALPVTDSQLSNEQAMAGRHPDCFAQVYGTPWLTPEPAVSELTVHEAPEGAGDEDDGAIAVAATAALQAAKAMARKITEDFSPSDGTALGQLLAQTGAPGPWKLAADHQPGLILATDNALACVVDVDNELPDDMATARALAIVLAVNAAAGFRVVVEA